mmetsp:Transcript_16768/g.33572  ORF Transcript_16768/g.33572 Transcript_16768/m.33572 type:complete len:205 (+) Transcript_16768:441-1055(+)
MFIFSGSAPRLFCHAIGIDAKASFTSYRSMSLIDTPALRSRFSVAGMGPASIITGSEPASAIAVTCASGCTPSVLSPASLQISTAAAPSVIWLAFPAVMRPPLKPGISGHWPSLTRVSSLDNDCLVVSARMPSSLSCFTFSPVFCFTPSRTTISSVNFPARVAAWALACDRAAYSSIASLVMSYLEHTISAPTNWLNISVPNLS